VHGRTIGVLSGEVSNGEQGSYLLPLTCPHGLAWDRFAGVVVVTNAVPVDYLKALRRMGKPVVLIGRQEPSFPCPIVMPDNRGGVKQAVAHLWDHGHRRIGFVGGHYWRRSAAERSAGGWSVAPLVSPE
jgi:DNA-binding LacI/PurR family transcriptional regulator